jgi:hypothetical protein
VPGWASFKGAPWAALGYRLILPLYDAMGSLVSVRARAVTPANPKALAPAGFSVAGLVLADSLARLMLAGEPLGDDSPAVDLVRQVGLVVLEGEPDFLTWATRASDANERAPAVVGLVSGSWTNDMAARVPDGTTVFVKTHGDDVGDKYARQVAGTLGERCRVMARKGVAA